MGSSSQTVKTTVYTHRKQQKSLT